MVRGVSAPIVLRRVNDTGAIGAYCLDTDVGDFDTNGRTAGVLSSSSTNFYGILYDFF